MQKQVEQTLFRAAATLLNLFSPTHTRGGIFPRGRAGSALHCSLVLVDLLLCQEHIIHRQQASSEITPPPQREGGVEHRQVNEELTRVV